MRIVLAFVLLVVIALGVIVAPTAAHAPSQDGYRYIASDLDRYEISSRIEGCFFHRQAPAMKVMGPIIWFVNGKVDGETLVAMAKNVHVKRMYQCIVTSMQEPV